MFMFQTPSSLVGPESSEGAEGEDVVSKGGQVVSYPKVGNGKLCVLFWAENMIEVGDVPCFFFSVQWCNKDVS